MSPRKHKSWIHSAYSWKLPGALENAGMSRVFEGLIAVYGGTGINSYLMRNVAAHPELIETFGVHQTNIANAPII
jgi:hypothetical protein